MTKEQFLIQYVLNRALTSANLDGPGAALQGALAWNKIQEELRTRVS